MNYIIRPTEVPAPGTIYTTEQEMVISTVPLAGNQFDLDNERVYGIIKHLILEGPGWAYITHEIDRSKHGRNAWHALQAHYKGESFLTKQKEDAYKVIDHLHYKGERATFTFEHFTGLMTKSYNDLQHFNEPVLESKKVIDLLSKITDPKLESAKQVIKINQQYRNDFVLLVNFLAESVETLDRGKTCMISEITQARGGAGRNQGGRFGCNNRGRGRGGGRNHSNQGQGHQNVGYGRGGQGGRGRGGRNSDSASIYIPPAEWNAMTSEQKQAFLQTRALSRIQALTSSLHTVPDDVSAITNITTGNVPANIAQVQTAQTVSANSSNTASQASTQGGASVTPHTDGDDMSSD